MVRFAISYLFLTVTANAPVYWVPDKNRSPKYSGVYFIMLGIFFTSGVYRRDNSDDHFV